MRRCSPNAASRPTSAPGWWSASDSGRWSSSARCSAAVWLFESVVDFEPAAAVPPAAFAPPRLQSDPAGELRDYQAAQRARLSGYAWTDRERGMVRIPIERAMAMIAARGGGAYEPLDPSRIPDPRR